MTDPQRPRLAPLPAPLWAVPLVLLVVAVGPWPYGFYMLLRLVVCGAAAYLAYSVLQGRAARWLGWAFVALAILYNPVFKVHFERETWMLINLASAVPFGIAGWMVRPRQD